MSPANQAAISELAAKLEPEFWAVSRAEDKIKLARLEKEGMTVGPPADDFIAALRTTGRGMWGGFTDKVEGTKPILDKFIADTGK